MPKQQIVTYNGHKLRLVLTFLVAVVMEGMIVHKSLEGILDREVAIAEAKELIDKWSPYLMELVNYASNLLGRCEKSMKDVKGTPSSLIHLYRHVIQMADGIQVLGSKACFDAAIPSLRSLWEGTISIEYMLKDDFEDRSTAWLACSHLEQRRYWDSLDLSSQGGVETEELRLKDEYLRNCDLGNNDQEDVGRMVRRYDMVLQKPKFKLVLSKLPKRAQREKKWYAVNEGPMSIKGLAEDLHRFIDYRHLYSYFSSVSHAKDASRTIALASGAPCLDPIRSSTSCETVYTLACTYLMSSTQSVAAKLRPSENVIQQVMDIILRHNPEAASL